jgi:2-keto-4-pentenoate hydratase
VHADIAAQLEAAEATREPVPPLTETRSGLSTDDAYAIQSAWLERKLAGGERLVGRKIGLTSVAMQEQLGVREPDFGFLLASMLVPSGGTLERGALLQPRVEPEIAFWLKTELRGPGVTVDDVLSATEAVGPALEIVDSRIANWRIKLVDTISDNGSSARAILGDRRTPIADVDLAAEQVVLSRNGEVVGNGVGSAVLGHPALAVAWLANTLSDFGQTLLPGMVILPGAMCASVFAQAGDTFRAEFLRLGAVEVRFT